MTNLFDDDNMFNEPKVLNFDNWVEKEFKQYDYIIAIPSYKRAKTLKDKTLGYLLKNKIDPSKIDIFVANDDEKKIYENILDSGSYHKIIVGEKGLCNSRNFIRSYYSEGQMLINLDDDIDDVERFVDQKTLVSLENLNEFFCYAFYVTQFYKAHYWGVYAVHNPYFMDDSIALGLRFLNGTMYGCIVSNIEDFKIVLEEKEDFERSIRAYLHDDTVVRFDFITYKSNEFQEPGGMQADGDRTELRNKQSGEYLLNKYPYLCKQNVARKNRFEVKLVEQRKDKRCNTKRIKWS